MKNDTQSERELFEAVVHKMPGNAWFHPQYSEQHGYIDGITNIAFLCFQAARTQTPPASTVMGEVKALLEKMSDPLLNYRPTAVGTAGALEMIKAMSLDAKAALSVATAKPLARATKEASEKLADLKAIVTGKASPTVKPSPAESMRLLKIAFTCERTGERHTFNSITDFIMAFLTVKRERDEALAAKPSLVGGAGPTWEELADTKALELINALELPYGEGKDSDLRKALHTQIKIRGLLETFVKIGVSLTKPSPSGTAGEGARWYWEGEAREAMNWAKRLIESVLEGAPEVSRLEGFDCIDAIDRALTKATAKSEVE